MALAIVNPLRWVAVVALIGCGNTAGDGATPPPMSAAGAAGGAGGPGAGGTAGVLSTGGAGSSTGGAPASGGVSGAGLGGRPGGGLGGLAGTDGAGAGQSPGGASGQGAAAGEGAGGATGGGGSGGVAAGSGGGGTGGSAGSVAGSAGSGPGGSTGATIVPDASWACGMPEGLPPPERGELLFRATLELDALRDVGVTQYGHRRLLDIAGGTITGDRFSGSFLEGGLDFELTLSNGSVELEQVGVLRAGNGALIYLRTCGVAPAGDSTIRVVFDFEVATSNALAWLNSGTFVGTRVVDEQAKTLTLTAYDMEGITASEPRVTLSDPDGVPDQPWDCATGTGTAGATVFTEDVGIGSSLSVGTSKRGNRNVIPITGGTMSGRVTGTVVPGGADFQLLSGTPTLDARYSLATNDDEVIVVRNCGPFGALVPTFEARAEGPYAFLNSGDYLSSDPGSSAGGVRITFYERN